jgi:hypothetical protein
MQGHQKSRVLEAGKIETKFWRDFVKNRYSSLIFQGKQSSETFTLLLVGFHFSDFIFFYWQEEAD